MSLLERYKEWKIPLQVIKDATEDFDTKYVIGRGGFGRVYKASLSVFGDKSFTGAGHPTKIVRVAVKRFSDMGSGQGEQQFKTEIVLLSNFNHPNIVSLVGFCDELGEMILVYELAFNESLDKYVSGSMSSFKWQNRLKICIGVARGLEYLHHGVNVLYKTIHRDIKSSNILLDDSWKAKITDFGLSEFTRPNKELASYVRSGAGTYGYVDPCYAETGALTKESDVFSFGVVLFEVLCGRLAYDYSYNDTRRFLFNLVRLKKLDELIDPDIKETINQDSLDTFSAIGLQCLRRNQDQRPTMPLVVKELEKALKLQISEVEVLRISFKEIKRATNNFDYSNIIGWGANARVYKGELSHSEGRSTVAVKRFNHRFDMEEEADFLTEIATLSNHRHENIIRLLGFCYEYGEKIVVYEHAFHGSLDKHLINIYNNVHGCNLTWTQRLKICLGAAKGLDFIHSDVQMQHRNVKSANILLNHEWEAKISNFGLSKKALKNRTQFLISSDSGTLGYCDPTYMKTCEITKESDVYSFGVVLFEILNRRVVLDNDCYYKEKENNKKIDDNDAKEEIESNSLNTFLEIANQCLKENPKERPTMRQIVEELAKALEFQENYDEDQNTSEDNIVRE